MKILSIAVAMAALMSTPSFASYPQCAGSTEPVKCNKLHDDLAKETPQQRQDRTRLFKEAKAATDKEVATRPNYKHIQSTERPRIGMTQAEVIDSAWGRPKDINTTTTANNVRQQWVYGSSRYLYFSDGVLTTIQE